MICCSFVFRPGEYDDEFYRLDDDIAEFARTLPGFIRIDSWRSADGLTRNAMYFFESMDDVRKLMTYPAHLEAKQKVDRWYEASRVDVFELQRSYGDKALRPA